MFTELPASLLAVASVVVVQPGEGFAAMLAAAFGGDWWKIQVWKMWLCAVVLDLAVQVFADPTQPLLLTVAYRLEQSAGG